MDVMVFESTSWQLLIQVVISFLCGALIGLEREKARLSPLKRDKEFEPSPGIRSFGFISLLGNLSVLIPIKLMETTSSAISIIVSATIALMVILVFSMYTYYRLVVMKETGVTTFIALALSYAIGVGVALGLIFESIAISIFTTFMLALKLRMERVIRVVTYEELLSALEIGIVVFLLGPFITQNMTDPFLHIVNLRILYIFFVVILVLSFVGYIMVKALGSEAIKFFAFFGGLVHSEATVVSIVKIARSSKRFKYIVSAGVLYATLAMILRNMILICIMMSSINVFSSPYSIWPLIILGFGTSTIIGYMLAMEAEKHVGEEGISIGLTKPVSYSTAIRALVAFIGILLATTYLNDVAGSTGIIVSSLIGGFMSAEAIIFTASTLVSAGRIHMDIAIAAGMLASVSAVFNKVLFIRVVGGSSLLTKKLVFSLVLISLPLLASIAILLYS